MENKPALRTILLRRPPHRTFACSKPGLLQPSVIAFALYRRLQGLQPQSLVKNPLESVTIF